MSWRKNGLSTAGAQPPYLKFGKAKKTLLVFFINEMKNMFKFKTFASVLSQIINSLYVKFR